MHTVVAVGVVDVLDGGEVCVEAENGRRWQALGGAAPDAGRHGDGVVELVLRPAAGAVGGHVAAHQLAAVVVPQLHTQAGRRVAVRGGVPECQWLDGMDG